MEISQALNKKWSNYKSILEINYNVYPSFCSYCLKTTKIMKKSEIVVYRQFTIEIKTIKLNLSLINKWNILKERKNGNKIRGEN